MNPRVKGPALYARGKKRLPGGTQLLSKRPEMFLPDQWPAYFDRAKGAHVWDLDGNRYLDMTISAIGACPLGFADDDVDAAVKDAITKGSMATLNAPEEVELAELLCELHPWADMVRYARCGGEAMAVAVRLARAATGKDKVAFCGYHGWQDWYLAANLSSEKSLDGHLLPGLQPAGVPRGLQGTALPFAYNHPEELDAIVRDHGKDIGVIVMEPRRYSEPAPGFLEHARAVADELSAVLIFDEVTAGFRMNVGGVHLLSNVRPDVAVFAKALSNGYPMAAVVGKGAVMEAAQRTFVSSTYWTDRVGPTAAIATIRKMTKLDVPARLIAAGNRVRKGWVGLAEKHGLSIDVKGMPPLSSFAIHHDDAVALSTLFTQEMLEKGFLAAKNFYATWAHTDALIDEYLTTVDGVFATMAKAAREKNAKSLLRGPLQHTGFARLA